MSQKTQAFTVTEPTLNSKITYERTADLAATLREAGYATIAEACSSRFSNIRHFHRSRRDETPEQATANFLRADMRLITEMETLLDALGVKLPRRRPGAGSALDAASVGAA